MSRYIFLLSGVPILFAAILSFSSPATAQSEKDKVFRIETEGKFQYLFEDNRDLGTESIDPESGRTLDLRAKVYYTPSDLFEAYAEASIVRKWGDASGEEDSGTSINAEKYAEWRQSWVQVNELFGLAPLSFQIGRMRLAEPHAFLWNRNTDTVRLKFETTTLSGFVGIAENLFSYRTSGDDFYGDRQDIANFLGEIGWSLDSQTRFEARGLHIADHSGLFAIGDIVGAKDRDDEDERLTWGSLRAVGERPWIVGPIDEVSYRLDAAFVTGDTTRTTTSSVTGSADRLVTGHTRRNVFGYAFDGDIDLTMSRAPLSPTVTLGYAFGSGDDGDGTDTAFRQPYLTGNSSRQGISSASSHNYGEALRVDLSNLHILKLGVGVPVMKASDLSFIYRDYWLDDSETGLRDERLAIDAGGNGSHVGRALDIVYNVPLEKEISGLSFISGADFRVTLGAFTSGDAFGAADDEGVFRGRTDFRIKF